MHFKKSDLIVSIRLMTYNHELFIREAMDSIMMQKTNFSFEIVVGDDFSIDKTLDIIRSYSDTNTVHIKILKREKGDIYWQNRQKLGRLYNFTNIIENCSGKYIALLDGDDYWTDPYKLQKQVDVLEKYPECVACHHWQRIAKRKVDGKYVEEAAPKDGHKENTGFYEGYYPVSIASVVNIFSLKLRPKIRTLLFRNIFREEKFPSWYHHLKFGDEPLNFILGKHGEFYFIDEEMAVYRYTNIGMSGIFKNTKGYIEGNKEWLKIWCMILQFYDYKYMPQAIVGMKLFLKRIFVRTENSILYKIWMVCFIFGMNLPFPAKLKLIYFCFESHYFNNLKENKN